MHTTASPIPKPTSRLQSFILFLRMFPWMKVVGQYGNFNTGAPGGEDKKQVEVEESHAVAAAAAAYSRDTTRPRYGPPPKHTAYHDENTYAPRKPRPAYPPRQPVAGWDDDGAYDDQYRYASPKLRPVYPPQRRQPTEEWDDDGPYDDEYAYGSRKPRPAYPPRRPQPTEEWDDGRTYSRYPPSRKPPPRAVEEWDGGAQEKTPTKQQRPPPQQEVNNKKPAAECKPPEQEAPNAEEEPEDDDIPLQQKASPKPEEGKPHGGHHLHPAGWDGYPGSCYYYYGGGGGGGGGYPPAQGRRFQAGGRHRGGWPEPAPPAGAYRPAYGAYHKHHGGGHGASYDYGYSGGGYGN